MKKLLLVASLVVATAAALAQGTVNFNNYVVPAGINAPVYDVDGTTKLAGTSFWVQLYGGPEGTPAESLVAVGSPINFRTGAAAGYFTGGTVAVTGVALNANAAVQVRAWNAPFATYEIAMVSGGGKWGWSNLLTVSTGGGGEPPKVPGDLIGLQSFTLIPEPSTIALALLGAAALLLRRRS
jgi:hypothetical protein